MKCDHCDKAEATVHITQVHGDHLTKIDLCQPCAEEGGLNDPTGMSLATLMEELKKRKREGAG